MAYEDNEHRKHRKFELILSPVLMNYGVASYLAGIEELKINWDHQTYVPKEKFTVDYVGTRSDGSLIHLEQETSGISGMQQRMLEYATALAITSEFKKRIHQVVFYTGDNPYRPTNTVTDLGAVFNWFKVLDAGATTVASAFLERKFPGAALSLLLRDDTESQFFMAEIIARIKKMPPEHHKRLLDLCRSISALKRRQEQWDLNFMRNWDHLTASDFMTTNFVPAMSRLQRKTVGLMLDHGLPYQVSDGMIEYLREKADDLQLRDFIDHAEALDSEDALSELLGIDFVKAEPAP